MKNTRKKMLLSSIAMLLVALIALGSATFAWFTSSPNAAASGLKMKTTSDKGLLVLSESEKAISGTDFSHSTVLRATGTAGHLATDTNSFNLAPASLTNSAAATVTKADRVTISNFLKAEADADNSYEKNATDASPATYGRQNSDVYAEKIYCKITGSDENTTVYLKGLTWTNPQNSYALNNTIRVAVADMDGKLVAIYGPDGTANGYLATASAASNATQYTPTAKNSTLSVDLSQANGTGEKYFTIYVYVDGEDTDCKSSLVNGADILSQLDINLSLNA